jgi:SRSO17 transposase
MLNIVTKPQKTLEKFLGNFAHLFGKKQFISFSIYISGLLLDLKRCSIQEIWNKAPDMTYRKIYYFLSISKWDPQQLNTSRVALLESRRTTRSTKKGVLAIDDTHNSKKYAFKTEGAMPQWSNTEELVVRGNVCVTSAFCAPNKAFPVNNTPYRTEDEFTAENVHLFKSKIDIAMELVDDAISKGIAFSDIVFDSWYCANRLIRRIESHGLTWISELKSNRNVSFRGKWVRADELATLIPSDRFRKATALNSAGKEISFWSYSTVTKVRGLSGKKKIVVSLGSWDDRDSKKSHIFVTNHLALTMEQVIHRIALRWKIECIYRELKDSFYFDHFQVRKIFRIERHWHLCMLAHSFLYWVRENGYFSKATRENIETLNEFKSVFLGLNSLHALEWIGRNRDQFVEYCRENRRKVG